MVEAVEDSPHAVSTYFLRRMEQQNGGKKCFRHYLKWLIVVDVKKQIVLAQRARQGPWVDTRGLPGVVKAAGRPAPPRLVLAHARVEFEAHALVFRPSLRQR